MKLNRKFRLVSSESTILKEWPIRALVVCLLLGIAPTGLIAQDPPPPTAPEATQEIISGTITELPPGKIVVNRAVPGKPAEDRTFLITAETKVEGRLKEKARVTVGFKTTEEGEVALRIIVRSNGAEPKKP